MKDRITAIALLLSLGTMCVSCGSSGNRDGVDTNESTGGDTSAVSESPFESDDLPELDFNGETLNILYREDVINAFYVSEQSGEVVDDAVYNSNKRVESRLNLTVNPILMVGSANDDRSTFMAAISKSVLAGDGAYDLCGVLTYNVPTLIQQGVLTDLMGVKYLNFDKPWWTASLTELATVDDKLFFASGDISLELIQRTFCMLFNKDLANALGTEDIYALVDDGKWTIDKMKELGAAAYADLNGDSKVDPEDRYGVVVNDYNHMSGFTGSLDLVFVKKDDDNRYHFAGNNERNVDAYQKMVSIFNDNDGIFYMNKSDANPATVAENHEVYRSMFKGDRLLLITTEFHQISSFYRDMQSEYGVIPYPKYDENQENYRSLARNVYSSFVIPKSCEKLDMTGAFMEASASQNHRDVAPVYFETALKVKYSRDDVSSRMYDLIKNGSAFLFDFTFSAIAGVSGSIIGMVRDNNSDWASKYASISEQQEAKLMKFYDDVEAFD